VRAYFSTCWRKLRTSSRKASTMPSNCASRSSA
jgi:hypothetical protein